MFTFESISTCTIEGVDPIVARSSIQARLISTFVNVHLAVKACETSLACTFVGWVKVGACAIVFTWPLTGTFVVVNAFFKSHWNQIKNNVGDCSRGWTIVYSLDILGIWHNALWLVVRSIWFHFIL